jgi:hypothetical protein
MTDELDAKTEELAREAIRGLHRSTMRILASLLVGGRPTDKDVKSVDAVVCHIAEQDETLRGELTRKMAQVLGGWMDKDDNQRAEAVVELAEWLRPAVIGWAMVQEES